MTKIKEIFSVGKSIKAIGYLKPGTPFFARIGGRIGHGDICLAVVVYVTCNKATYPHWDVDLRKNVQTLHDKIEYYVSIVHHYEKGEFVPGLVAKDELVKYSNINRKNAISMRENWISDSSIKSKQVFDNMQETQLDFLQRVREFDKSCVDFGLGRSRSNEELVCEYNRVQDNRKREYQTLTANTEERKNEIELLNNAAVVPIQYQLNSRSYRFNHDCVITNDEIFNGETIFATSNDMIKYNIGKPYDKSFQDVITLGSSNIITHSLGEDVYLYGGTRIYKVNMISYHLEIDLDGTCHNELKYLYHPNACAEDVEISESDFSYSDNLVSMIG